MARYAAVMLALLGGAGSPYTDPLSARPGLFVPARIGTFLLVATIVGFLLILPILVSFLPNPWNDDIGKYLPSEAGAAIFHIRPRGVTLSPGGGLAVLCAYAAASLLIGAVLLTARDA